MAAVAAGEPAEVRRRKEPAAVLFPARPEDRVALPGFAGRLRAIYGEDAFLQTPATDLVSQAEAERLSASYSEQLGTRSLDITHVAAALVLGASEFLSFDRRQSRLAAKVGLRVVDLRAPMFHAQMRHQ